MNCASSTPTSIAAAGRQLFRMIRRKSEKKPTKTRIGRCVRGMLYRWPANQTIRLFVMNSDCEKVERFVAKHNLNLGRVFTAGSPVTENRRRLPADRDVLLYLASQGLMKENFGRDLLHAMCRRSILSSAGKCFFDVIVGLAALHFDLEHRVNGNTVLEVVAKGLARENHLSGVSTYFLQKLLITLVDLGCQPIYADKEDDALRILVRALAADEGGQIQGGKALIDRLPRQLQLNYYDAAGAYQLIKAVTNERRLDLRRMYKLNVGYSDLGQAAILWAEADNGDDTSNEQTSTKTDETDANTSSERTLKEEFIFEAVTLTMTYNALTIDADANTNRKRILEKLQNVRGTCRFQLIPFYAELSPSFKEELFDVVQPEIAMSSADTMESNYETNDERLNYEWWFCSTSFCSSPEISSGRRPL